jgi:rod shape determining protein RodA
MRGNLLIFRLDWISIFLLIFLIIFGWVNIYSTTVGNDLSGPLLDLGTFYGKQLFFAILSLIVVILYSFIPDQFIERFSSVFYLIGIALLLGLFVFGKTIAGATSWYDLGPFNFQPSELMKMIVALALAK